MTIDDLDAMYANDLEDALWLPRFDVDDDGVVSPLDLLHVINTLNARVESASQSVAIELNGRPLSFGDTIRFDATAIGESRSLTLKVRNQRETTLDLIANIEQGLRTDFALATNPNTQLAAGEEIEVEIKFRPQLNNPNDDAVISLGGVRLRLTGIGGA